MMRRCNVKTDEKTGRFLKNGQSRKKGWNRAISEMRVWGDLILKIEYLAAQQGKVVIKISPKYSSVKNAEIVDTLTNQIEMVKNSSVWNVDLTNTLILARQKPSEIEMRK
jgi:hypothetical protein